MFDGNGGSGGDDDVRDDGDARVVGPREPRTPDCPALSPDRAARTGPGAVGAGGATAERTGVVWKGTPCFWPEDVCCGCIVEGAGGGWRFGWLGGAGGTRPVRCGEGRGGRDT